MTNDTHHHEATGVPEHLRLDRCARCDYMLTNAAESGSCPECGKSYERGLAIPVIIGWRQHARRWPQFAFFGLVFLIVIMVQADTVREAIMAGSYMLGLMAIIAVVVLIAYKLDAMTPRVLIAHAPGLAMLYRRKISRLILWRSLRGFTVRSETVMKRRLLWELHLVRRCSPMAYARAASICSSRAMTTRKRCDAFCVSTMSADEAMLGNGIFLHPGNPSRQHEVER